MKKSIKIVSMTDFHGSPKKATTPSSATRRGFVQGTLDIVTPRSPIHSCESVPVSSPASVISSKNSYTEYAHATPRLDQPRISVHEEPQPERPSTCLELSDDEAESYCAQEVVKEAARVAVVDGRSGHGVEVPLCFGSAPPAAKVQRHAEVGRPFGDASNLPGRASAPITPKQNRETQAPPLPEPEDGEENRKKGRAGDSAKSQFRSPKIYSRLASGDVPSLTLHDSQSSHSLAASESPTCSSSRAETSEVEKGKKTKKKKGRVVESRFLKPSAAPSLSMSMSAVGRPLLNSTAVDSTQVRSVPTSRPKKPAQDSRLSSPAAVPARRITAKKAPPKEKEKEEEKEKPSILAGAPSKKGLVCSQQDVDLLYAIYVQFAYLNALAANHERRQEEQFQAEFGVLCDAYRERREKLVTLRKELLYWRSVHALEDSITAQISALEPLLGLFPEFGARFNLVAKALDKTRHRLALKDLVLPSENQLAGWQKQLAEEAARSADILNQVLSESPLTANHLESLCGIVEQLVAMREKHDQLFEVARDMVTRADQLFAEESSLRIHECQEAKEP